MTKEVKELIQKNENLTEQLRQYDKNFNLYLTHISKLENQIQLKEVRNIVNDWIG